MTTPLYFLAALAGASTTDPSVLDVYREACVDGQFQLTPDRGKMVEGKRPPPGVFNFPDGPPGPDHTIYIEMKKPADTFVVIEQFESPKAKFESICRVTSRHWFEKDAQLAFIAGTTNPKVVDMRDSGHPYEPFIIDQPPTACVRSCSPTIHGLQSKQVFTGQRSSRAKRLMKDLNEHSRR